MTAAATASPASNNKTGGPNRRVFEHWSYAGFVHFNLGIVRLGVYVSTCESP